LCLVVMLGSGFSRDERKRLSVTERAIPFLRKQLAEGWVIRS
jgi:hypothetical protein